MSSLPILVQHPPRERWGSIVNLALSNRPVEERIRQTEWLLRPPPGQPREAGFAGLREARCGDELLGAALAIVQPGRTALVFQPQLLPGVAEKVRAELAAEMDRFLVQNHVRLAQELLPLAAEADAQRARAAGYAIDVKLAYLSRPLAPQEAPSQHNELRFVPYAAADEMRLGALLDHTYEQTADCPELNGVRSSLDTIAGYRAAGVPLWYFVQHHDRDIGCLLLSQHEQHLAELVYMGLAPQSRGKGWGKTLVRGAVSLAAQAGSTALSLAVDARNLPALHVYRQAGFSQFDERRVFLKVFPE